MSKKTTICKHCREIIETWKCDTCEKIIANQCVGCHYELSHGATPKTASMNRGGLGDCHWVHESQYDGWNSAY